MRSFMAGATMIGHAAAMSAVDRASSAMPAAILPMILAVAGTTRARSRPSVTAICPMLPHSPSVNSSVNTGIPLKAGEGQGRYEPGSVPGHDDPHFGVLLPKPPQDINGLIGSYSAGYPQKNARSGHHANHARTFSRYSSVDSVSSASSSDGSVSSSAASASPNSPSPWSSWVSVR